MNKKVIRLTENQLTKLITQTIEEQDKRGIGQKLKDATINRVGSKFASWEKNGQVNPYKQRMNNVYMYKLLKYLENVYMKLNPNLKTLINIQDVNAKIAEYEQNGLTK